MIAPPSPALGSGGSDMWRLPWTRREERAADATAAVITALLANARGQDVTPDGLAAIEMAAGLVGRAFASVQVTGDRFSVVTPLILELIGRSLIRAGELVIALDEGPRLTPASGWTIRGRDNPADWVYRVDFAGPSGFRSAFLSADSLIHVRVNCDPARPWAGRAPHAIASSTAKTAASAEKSAGAEASIPAARIAPVPAADEAQREAFKSALSKGGMTVVQAAAQAALSGGAGQEPSTRWTPAVLHPEPTEGHLKLRREAAADVLSACGIPTALFDARADGTARREAYRQLIFVTLAPLAAIVQSELRDKLDSPNLMLSFSGLHGADLATRGRALKQLVESGVALDEAMSITGLSEVA